MNFTPKWLKKISKFFTELQKHNLEPEISYESIIADAAQYEPNSRPPTDKNDKIIDDLLFNIQCILNQNTTRKKSPYLEP